ncbi:hypothetical protein V1477_014403 [Vespula maculifrons]|uniref:Uncharacterized protein n=1 Tax=Vespula maculifrons TaxID=7453 RepID=A0ABD2BLF4_VESMC
MVQNTRQISTRGIEREEDEDEDEEDKKKKRNKNKEKIKGYTRIYSFRGYNFREVETRYRIFRLPPPLPTG